MQAQLSEKKKKKRYPLLKNSETAVKKSWMIARSDVVSGFAPYVYTSFSVLYGTCTVQEIAPLPGADHCIQQRHFCRQ